VRALRIVYALGCTAWAVYVIRMLVGLSASHPEATLSGGVFCVLLLVVLPSTIGYVLLFKTFPWARRLIWR
jgi:hypothetical protein